MHAALSTQVKWCTGSEPLDDAATAALRHWRLKPGLYQRVIIPMTFTLQGRGRTDHEQYPPHHEIFDERPYSIPRSIRSAPFSPTRLQICVAHVAKRQVSRAGYLWAAG